MKEQHKNETTTDGPPLESNETEECVVVKNLEVLKNVG
jgi:hypothetical protein